MPNVAKQTKTHKVSLNSDNKKSCGLRGIAAKFLESMEPEERPSMTTISNSTVVGINANPVQGSVSLTPVKKNESGEYVPVQMDCVEISPLAASYYTLPTKADREYFADQVKPKVSPDGTIHCIGVPIELRDDIDLWEIAKNNPKLAPEGSSWPIQEDPYRYIQIRLGLISENSDDPLASYRRVIKTPEQLENEADCDTATKNTMQNIIKNMADVISQKSGYSPNEATLTYSFSDNSFGIKFENDTYTRHFFDHFVQQEMNDNSTFAGMTKQLDSLMSSLYGQDKKVTFQWK